jgi:hypothetical protein
VIVGTHLLEKVLPALVRPVGLSATRGDTNKLSPKQIESNIVTCTLMEGIKIGHLGAASISAPEGRKQPDINTLVEYLRNSEGILYLITRLLTSMFNHAAERGPIPLSSA